MVLKCGSRISVIGIVPIRGSFVEDVRCRWACFGGVGARGKILRNLCSPVKGKFFYWFLITGVELREFFLHSLIRSFFT